MIKLWKTVHETPQHIYQEHRLLRKRRAVPKTSDARAPAHRQWLEGGHFNKRKGKAA